MRYGSEIRMRFVMLETSSKTQAESLANALRLDIVRGMLKPGDKLGMAALQERYDVGLTPLREALSRLTSLGLVTAEGQRGFRVSRVSSADLLDLIKTMAWIDGIALSTSIAFGDRDWEADIVAAAHRLGVGPGAKSNARFFEEGWEQAHRVFHRSLVAACRAPRLLEHRAILYDNVDRYRRLSALYERGIRDVDAEHRALVDAALARDSDKAVRLMENHLIETARNLLKSDPATADQAETMIAALRKEIRIGRTGGSALSPL
jgi:GntR family transcriptional regulator, carbon starvation induced regulator